MTPHALSRPDTTETERSREVGLERLVSYVIDRLVILVPFAWLIFFFSSRSRSF